MTIACQTPLFGPPPDYIRACGLVAVGSWRTQRRCRTHMLEAEEMKYVGAEYDVHWDLDPAQGLLFWLCVPIVLVYLAGKVALAWLKTKLPHAPAPVRRCHSCGWPLAEDETRLLCGVCYDDQRRRAGTR